MSESEGGFIQRMADRFRRKSHESPDALSASKSRARGVLSLYAMSGNPQVPMATYRGDKATVDLAQMHPGTILRTTARVIDQSGLEQKFYGWHVLEKDTANELVVYQMKIPNKNETIVDIMSPELVFRPDVPWDLIPHRPLTTEFKPNDSIHSLLAIKEDPIIDRATNLAYDDSLDVMVAGLVSKKPDVAKATSIGIPQIQPALEPSAG